MDTISFDGVDYSIRVVLVVDSEGFPYEETFVTDALHSALRDATGEWSDTNSPKAKKAMLVDCNVTFYVRDEKELTELSDEELLNLII